MTRWGYLRDAFRNLAAFAWLSGCLLVQNGAAPDWQQWQLIPSFLLVLLYVIFLLVSSGVNFRRWAGLCRAGVRWTTGKAGRESSGFSTFLLTGLATLLSFVSLALTDVVSSPSLMLYLWVATGPLMLLSLAFEGKHQRERRAIERTMNELAQTLANVAGGKARRESAAQRGTNATIGGVSRRASWTHWWTDAGTRDEVEQKQEDGRR